MALLRDKSSEDTEFFLSIDNSKSPCCVDYIAAAHVDADLLVKFGESCLCEEPEIPTLYIFEKENFDVKSFSEKLLKSHQEDTYVNHKVVIL